MPCDSGPSPGEAREIRTFTCLLSFRHPSLRPTQHLPVAARPFGLEQVVDRTVSIDDGRSSGRKPAGVCDQTLSVLMRSVR